MKFKRKIAGLLAALMVVTLGSTTTFADTFSSPAAGDYQSPSAGDYGNAGGSGGTEDDYDYEVNEEVAPGIRFVATSTDSKTPWAVIDGEALKDLNGSIAKALNYKSTKNVNQVDWLDINGLDITKGFSVSQANMSIIAKRGGSLSFGSDKHSMWTSTINNGNKAFDFSFNVKDNATVSEKLKALGVKGATYQFEFGGKGSYPGTVTVDAELSNEGNMEWTEGFLYLYNAATGKFEYVDAIGTNGLYMYLWDIEKAGNYVWVSEKLPKDATTGNVISVTGSATDAKSDAELTDGVNKTIDSAEKGSIIKLPVLNKGVKVEQKVFEAAKNKDVTLVVNSKANNATFKFSNFDQVSNMSGAFDPTVEIGNSIIPAIDKAMSAGKNKDVKYTTVSFAYDGMLPGKTEVTLDVSTGDFKEGATVYLYYFNEKTNKFELIDSAVYSEGFATFEMTHCSDYIVTAEKLDQSVTEPINTPGGYEPAKTATTPIQKVQQQIAKAATAVKTGDVSPIIPLAVVLFAGMAVIVVAFARKKRA